MIHRTNRMRLAGAAALASALALTACSSGGDGGGSGGGTVTVWARSNAIGEGLFTPLVDEWNKTHDTQIQLTLIPSAQIPAKIAAAAGARQLPDVLISDVGNVPSLISQGVLADIGSRIDDLSFEDTLAPSAIDQGTSDGKRYAVPADVDPSLMYVNKTLLAKAGVTEVPTSLQQVAQDAQEVRALGGNDYGFYAAGSCGGCLIFTTAPSVWASGGQVTDDKGAIDIATDAMSTSLASYRDMWNAGVMPPDSKADTGSNWANVFAPGNIAIQFNGSSLLGALTKANVPFEWDVAGIPGPDGGTSSYIGGDTFSITTGSPRADEAWSFISWALDTQQQNEVYAKNGWLTVRTDLTDNQYNKDDPRLQRVNELIKVGKTVRSPASAQVFNDPTGPWLAAFRKVVYDGDPGALADGQKQVAALASGN